ncbi:probable glycosyl hydrolase [Claviceps purpurea 20.1]|uniref:alpha-1,2-Mannosidase n=1 Tax=Claviceps purpurea (strain 20.1) TaxID=1111077 RepID=M1VXS5_CLAP2|nr:probable glycosyl hydrolase [Claviceps purpurea 20.1]
MAMVVLLWLCTSLPWLTVSMRMDRLAQLRQDTVDMFYHGFSNYMKHAFPEDELRPLTCSPLTRDRNDPSRIELNDALGNYSLTLIDSLSTLAILAGGPQDGSYTGPQALSDFQDGVAQFVAHYGDGRPGRSGMGSRARGFDLDSKVQVFETVIRGLGGLLSAHLFAVGELPISGYDPKPMPRDNDDKGDYDEDDPLQLAPIAWPNGLRYDGQLLRLALDLAERLLPAFYTKTGIPYPRVNLRTGIPFYVNSPLHWSTDGQNGQTRLDGDRLEITETCSAGAGSLTLEFTVLSRLTGDSRFEHAAKRAFWEVWSRRSEIGLIGNGIDAEQGLWIGPHSGIGAGMDSFFEYAFKSHILLSGHDMPNVTSPTTATKTRLDPNALHGPLPREMHLSDTFLQAWREAHASVKSHIYTNRSHYPYYSNSHRATGQPYTMWIDSLGAFYPGLLALAGEVEEAIEANLVYTALWTRYSALPERWSIRENNVEPGIGWWPGRPEFIESTYHIYRATQDPWYLHVGEMVLRDIRRRCYASCGWAGLQDVRTGEKQNRMESFFLGETAKYMYLLFDPDHALNKLDAAYVFTTEGHPLIIPKGNGPRASLRQRQKQRSVKEKKRKKKKMQGLVSASQAAQQPPLEDEEEHHLFINTCPAPPVLLDPLTGSSTAARPDLFGVSRFTNLYNTPNIHGPMQQVVVPDADNKRLVTKYRPLSNHTLFPWTLPPTMLPPNGTCVAPMQRILSAIEFPASDAATSLLSRFGASLTWHSYLGPTVKSLEGLRLQLEREFSDRHGDYVWKITHAGNTQLGRQESVFFYGEHVRQLRDEAFTALRQQDWVEVHLLVDVNPPPHTFSETNKHKNDTPTSQHTTCPSSSSSSSLPRLLANDNELEHKKEPSLSFHALQALPPESLLKHLFRAVTSVFDPSETSSPDSQSHSSGQSSSPKTVLYAWQALSSVGPGSHPLPAVLDSPLPDSPGYNAQDPMSHLPWENIYLGGQACHAALPESAPQDNQVIVLRRGGCPFSQKLGNIPSFSPGADSLQLVIVVDEDQDQHDDEEEEEEDDDDDDDIDGDDDHGADSSASAHAEPLPRPLLETEQRTPTGAKRPHGIPLVLMSVGKGEYELFGRARGVGLRSKYAIQSQGLLIENAIVL